MENVLGSLDGVVDAKADYIAGSATVSYDPSRVTPVQMVEAINTRSFFRAGLPAVEGAVVGTSGGVNVLPFAAAGVLLVLAGVGVWRFSPRRQSNRTAKTQTS